MFSFYVISNANFSDFRICSRCWLEHSPGGGIYFHVEPPELQVLLFILWTLIHEKSVFIQILDSYVIGPMRSVNLWNESPLYGANLAIAVPVRQSDDYIDKFSPIFLAITIP